jgi:addiction module HigA family antidote
MAATGENTAHYEPDYAVPPGDTLLEKIQEMGMNQAELAMRLGLSEKHVSRIMNGIEPITQATAIGLERVTGIPAQFWNAREAIYRERLARMDDAERLRTDLKALDDVPFHELVLRGYVTEKTDKTVQLQQVLAFFGVNSTTAMYDMWASDRKAARRSRAFASHPGCTATWLRLGEIAAQKTACHDYDRATFMRTVLQIRGLTVRDPAAGIPEVQRLCAEVGVAVVLVPEIRRARWHGASWWMTPSKAVIELNLRGKKDDQFWFSFFHEAGHILHDSKKDVFINDQSEDDPIEQKANTFARNTLIPPDRIAVLKTLRTDTEARAFATSLGIAPGIVAGRYQWETRRYDRFNKLKRTLVWAE